MKRVLPAEHKMCSKLSTLMDIGWEYGFPFNNARVFCILGRKKIHFFSGQPRHGY